MDVFFSADDGQEYLDLLCQSASRYVQDFLAWCVMKKSRPLHLRAGWPLGASDFLDQVESNWDEFAAQGGRLAG